MPRRILILRRENIGDLIVSTPLLRTLRQWLPDAHLAALVNSYNAPVIAANPDLDSLHVYTKGKHAGSLFDVARARASQLRLLLRLRGLHFDDVVLAEPTYTRRNIHLANFILGGPFRRAGTRIVGFEDDDGDREGLDSVASKAAMDGLHMVQIIMRLAEAYRHTDTPVEVPACRVVAPAMSVPSNSENRVHIALHISARKPSQRWPIASFAALAGALGKQFGARITVLWSPGTISNALHPGDDEKAAALQTALTETALNGRPDVEFVPTPSLDALIVALARADLIVCGDGGAMHVAAGLGKPVVALFGDSDPVRWRPWGVAHRVLQKSSRDVADIAVAEVMTAADELVRESKLGG